MDRRRYDYHQPAGAFAVGFLYLWSGFWLFACVGSFFRAEVVINDEAVPIREALPFLFAMTAIGMLVLVGGIVCHIAWLKWRIELSTYDIAAYDFLGRLRVRADLSQVTGRTGGGDKGVGVIETAEGPIRYIDQIRYRDDLERRIDRWLSVKRIDLPTDKPRATRFGYPRKVFRNNGWSRLSGGLLWVGFIAFLFASIWAGGIGYSLGLAMSLLLLLFAFPGAWLLASCFVERIVVDGDTLEWVDWLGRRRVRIALGEIQGLSDYDNDGDRCYTIATPKGDIHFRKQMPGSEELREIIRSSLAVDYVPAAR